MYNTIVVGTDGSDHSHDAVRRAGELAKVCGTMSVHVVWACVPYSGCTPSGGASTDPESHLARASAILDEIDVQCEGHEVRGDPSTAILDVAERWHANLIVVGARGMGAVARFVRGSVSTSIAHHATCDVLIVEHDS